MVNPLDGDGDGLTECEKETEADGEADKEADNDGLSEMPVDGEGDRDTDEEILRDAEGLAVGLADADGLSEEEGDADAEGDLLASSNPSSTKACVPESESIRFLISIFFPNLNAPGIPLSS